MSKRSRDGAYIASASEDSEENKAISPTVNSVTASHSDGILELKNQIEILNKRVEKLEAQNNREYRLSSNILERTSVPFPATNLIGEQYVENAANIIAWLKNPDVSTIGVWGMGGVGKTALLEHICNQLIQDTTFSADVYWLTVLECDTVYQWQASIATCFGFDLSSVKDGRKRKNILHTELATRGRIVLILDDMWHPFRRDEVGIPAGVNGCKIILTTRSLQVCRRMKCGHFTIKVQPLSLWESEALALFVNEVKDYGKLTEDVKEVARKVVRKCHGLPLAIITMGFRMAGEVDINEWATVLSQLDTCEQIDMKDKVLSKLQKSYDSLNQETLAQMCFLSSIFYFAKLEWLWTDSISRIDVMNCWIEEGLLDETGNNEERLRRGDTIMNRLIDLSLLDEDDIGYSYIYLDDLIRDMAIHITKENQCRMIMKSDETARELPDEALWTDDLVIASLQIERIPLDMSPNCAKLKVLNLERNPLVEIPESFFVHMKALTVLNLSGTSIKRLPNSVCNLENLRTLKLASCRKLVHVPSLANNLKLKVLDLENTSNFEGIWE